jgi:MFS family permease
MRGALEGFQPSTIGFMGTFYFLGFLLGCLSITRMMRAVGHVRLATLAATASARTLLLVLVIDPVMWSAIRFATGFCFAACSPSWRAG